MKFKADEIASVIQKEIEDFRGQIQTAEVGRVIEVGDGIARCTGLSNVMSGEMLEFPIQQLLLYELLDLDPRNVVVV